METSTNISKNSKGGFVEEQIIDCVKDIISKIRIEFDIEYKDVTYKELYIKITISNTLVWLFLYLVLIIKIWLIIISKYL